MKKIKSFLFENKTNKQTIIKNTLWLILAEGISKGGIFLITIIIARLLWPEDFGILSFIMSFVAMFLVITDFGLTTLMVREVSKDHKKIKDYLINLSFLKIILWIITFLIVLIVSHFIWKDNFYITLILIYCWYAIINNFWEFIRAFFRPSEKMQYEAFLKIINGLLMIWIVVYTVFHYGDLESILYSYLIAWIISFIISITYVGWKFKIGKIKELKLDKNILISSLKSGIYLMWGLIFITIFVNIDQFLLWYFWFNKELWLYSAMYKILFIFTVLSQIIVQVLIPNILKKYSFSKIKKILKIFSIFSLILFIISIIFWNNIIIFLFWKSYIGWYPILIIFFMTYIFTICNHLTYPLLNSLHFEKTLLLFTIIAWSINLILNLIFIPIYLEKWAAITTLISEIILFFLIFFKYYKTLKNYKTN